AVADRLGRRREPRRPDHDREQGQGGHGAHRRLAVGGGAAAPRGYAGVADERVPRSVLHGVRHEGGGVLKLYLDCDTGVDDALAIAYLLATPSVSLLGIGTCNGNTSAVQAARNTLGLLDLSHVPDIPVAIGEGEIRRGAGTVHGDNGVGGVLLPDGGSA